MEKYFKVTREMPFFWQDCRNEYYKHKNLFYSGSKKIEDGIIEWGYLVNKDDENVFGDQEDEIEKFIENPLILKCEVELKLNNRDIEVHSIKLIKDDFEKWACQNIMNIDLQGYYFRVRSYFSWLNATKNKEYEKLKKQIEEFNGKL